jgi:hypothetical protein
LIRRGFFQAREQQVSQILFDMLAMDGALTSFERYELAEQVADYVQQQQWKPRRFVGTRRPSTDSPSASAKISA